ncbi:hypothetical protein [Candidatus Nitrosocosmicus sp. FF01]|uniref:hypothetical protein n=1 Tax=Candidatus Nitrosocosmicus sp. FF01 TaxID=3397670 RepID=UPI0039ED7CB5
MKKSNPQMELKKIIEKSHMKINEMIGYEYYSKSDIEVKSNKLVQLLPLMEKVTKFKRPISVDQLSNEIPDYDKCTERAIEGLLGGHIIKNYAGTTTKEKFENYLYYSGIEQIRWIANTSYDGYYKRLFVVANNIKYKIETIGFVKQFLSTKFLPTTQGLSSIFLKEKFWKEKLSVDESIIDEFIEIFRSLVAIYENKLKLLYGIKYHKYQDIKKLERKKFYEVWSDLKEDDDYNLFTTPLLSTIYWNASKHDGITKVIYSKTIRFESNEGTEEISYEDFLALVRELYACVSAFMKFNLILYFQDRYSIR